MKIKSICQNIKENAERVQNLLMNDIVLEPVSIEHKPLFDSFREKESLFNGDYCFGNLYGWGAVLNTKVCFYKGMYSSVARISKKDMLISFPLGEGDKKEFVYTLKNYVENLGFQAVLGLFNSELMKEAKGVLGADVEFLRRRDSDDYIYLTEDLISLSGPELHSKKNMLNSFLKQEFTYEEINENNKDFARDFCLEKAYTNNEKIVIERMFECYGELDLTGAIIKIGGGIVGATVAEKSGETVIIHIEKAEKDVRGAYAGINNLFLKNSMSGTLFVNREDDMGLSNLRKAKLSYKPYRMEEKFIGVFK